VAASSGAAVLASLIEPGLYGRVAAGHLFIALVFPHAARSRYFLILASKSQGQPGPAFSARAIDAPMQIGTLPGIEGPEVSMKCPNCDAELVLKKRDGIEMEICPSCNGMWLSRQELEQLEDEVFDFGDDEKGSLMLGSAPTTRKCPQCARPMQAFQYRLYDLEMDFCDAQHGYWLEADEDQRVLELMKEEEKNLGRKVLAEDRFAAHLRYLRSGSFLDRIRDLATRAMDPKTRPKF
jgi:Zn-finger nucleic acid-binding protein